MDSLLVESTYLPDLSPAFGGRWAMTLTAARLAGWSAGYLGGVRVCVSPHTDPSSRWPGLGVVMVVLVLSATHLG